MTAAVTDHTAAIADELRELANRLMADALEIAASTSPDDGPRIDPFTLDILHQGRRVDLRSVIRIRILGKLLQRPGMVSYGNLIRSAWRDDEVLGKTAVQTQVSRLKKSLSGGGLHDLSNAIRSVDGGYQLVRFWLGER